MKGHDALRRLRRGHAHYLAGEPIHPRRSAERRAETARAQDPFAVILGCSDSRVSPEVIFDQGLGDLFIIRTAGEVLDRAVLGSIEFAVDHLGVSLILVLAHSACGAVRTALEVLDGSGDAGEATGNARYLVEAIAPAVEAARRQPGDLVENAVKEHGRRVARRLREEEPHLACLIRSQETLVAVGYYDLHAGDVELLAE